MPSWAACAAEGASFLCLGCIRPPGLLYHWQMGTLLLGAAWPVML